MLKGREARPSYYLDRDARVAKLEAQGLEGCWLFPTLGARLSEAGVTLVAHSGDTNRPPHVEGMREPLEYLSELQKFDAPAIKKIMRDNALELNQPLPPS